MNSCNKRNKKGEQQEIMIMENKKEGSRIKGR
jgi:hypothetical protein